MLAREGIQPNHESQRGPVAPIQDPKYPLGGTLGFAEFNEFAQWRVTHDAGSAFVVWVAGTDKWETEYVDTLPESVADESFDRFLQKCAEATKERGLRAELAQAVLDSLGISSADVPKGTVAAAESFVKEGAITAPEFPKSAFVPDIHSRVAGGLVMKIPDVVERAEKGLTP